MTIQRLMLISMLAVSALCQPATAMERMTPAEKKVSPFVSFMRDLVIGGATGVIEVTCNQPLIFLKNCVQQKRQIPWGSPVQWYRGYVVNAGSMAPITGLQMGISAGLTAALQEGDEPLSPNKKIFVATLAGALSAVVSAPAEHAMIEQQLSGKSLWAATQKLIAGGMYQGWGRGFIPGASRDGGFTAGYLAIAPLVKRELREYVDSEPVAAAASGALTGVATTLVTHPWDTIKTVMQSGSTESMTNTIRRLYHEGGIISFWRGSVARGTRVVLAITLMSEAQELLSEQFAKMGLGGAE